MENHVICATDNGYVLPLLVMLQSAKLNSRNKFSISIGYDFNELTAENRVIISSVLDILEIEFEFIELELTDDMLPRMHISATAYARLLMVPQSKGFSLWLDADLICLSNWDSIFSETDSMQENSLVSVVRDSGISAEMIRDTKNESLRIAELNYFNSGVILFNHSHLIDSGFSTKWPEILNRADELGFEWADQCLLNYICRNKVNFLSPRYNVMAGSRRHGLRSKPYILHFAGGSKPWFYSAYDLRILIGNLYPKDVYRYLMYQKKLIRKVKKRDPSLAIKLKSEQAILRRKLHHPTFRSAVIRLFYNITQIK